MREPITVVIPVGQEEHNRRWLPEAIASVESQIEAKDEILLVFDGPQAPFDFSDCTNTHAVQIPWRVGHPAAMNIGIATASNELVAMMGSDDKLLPDALAAAEHQWRKLKRRPGYYWWTVTYVDGSVQIDPCNAAMVTKEFWHQTGGFPVEAAVGQEDAIFIDAVLHYRPDDLIPIQGGVPRYWVRQHEDQRTNTSQVFAKVSAEVKRINSDRGFVPVPRSFS